MQPVFKNSNQDSFTLSELDMSFVYIQPGQFNMGSPVTEDGRGHYEDRHLVRITQGFFMQETEVTQIQWQMIMAGTETAPVASYVPNNWNLYDMHGNVAEWCNDWIGYYEFDSATEAVENPSGADEGTGRIQRGGSWYHDAVDCRSALRGWGTPGTQDISTGFRLVVTMVE